MLATTILTSMLTAALPQDGPFLGGAFPLPSEPIRLRYDEATGAVTPQPEAALLPGPDVLYDNTCPAGFFYGLASANRLTVTGQLPATDDGNIQALGGAGCADAYGVNGFEIGYVTAFPTYDVRITFYSLYAACTDPSLATPVYTQDFMLPGSPDGNAAAFFVEVDLAQTISLAASGDGTWDNDPTLDSFGFSMEILNGVSNSNGPILAGLAVDNGSGCEFGVGTVFEYADPTSSAPNGTGYGSVDFWYEDIPASPGSCFFVGGWPYNPGGFHLRLLSDDAGCGGAPEPGTPFCFGTGCPCGNDSATTGCVNSTGQGALLTASGTTSVAADDLLLSTTGAPPSNTGLYFMGGGTFAPVFVGDGLACTGGIWRYFPSQVSPSGVFDLSSPVAGAFAGAINPGDTRHFQSWTRDVLCGPPPAPCPTPCGNNSNLSNGYTVVFTP